MSEKELSMVPKKGNGAQAPSAQQTDESSVSHEPTQDQIRLRAYQIYLEPGYPGQELDDWLRAELELQKVALSHEAGIALSNGVNAAPKTENDIRSIATMERGKQ